MSRLENDAWEAAQAEARDIERATDDVLATTAALRLQRERLEGRFQALRRKRGALRTMLDGRPGSGMWTLLGVCLGAVLARGGWELRASLTTDERLLLGLGAFALSLALTISRTHWFRFGLGS